MGYDPDEPRDDKGRWSSSIVDSLKAQLIKKGTPKEKVQDLAVEILQGHGILDAKGELTAKGREREALGHKGRVIDRAARQLGRKPEEIGIQNKRPYVK
jgi:hypothetical protein